jgi:hypothetical protein
MMNRPGQWRGRPPGTGPTRARSVSGMSECSTTNDRDAELVKRDISDSQFGAVMTQVRAWPAAMSPGDRVASSKVEPYANLVLPAQTRTVDRPTVEQAVDSLAPIFRRF